MSTNCIIGFTTAGKVRTITCHTDGYPNFMGRMLHEHYQDPAKVEQLIVLGDLYLVAERVAPEPGEEHSYHKRIKGVTVAYHRDGRELEVFEEGYRSFRSVHNDDLPWLYHFHKGVWWVRKNDEPRWMHLSARLKKNLPTDK